MTDTEVQEAPLSAPATEPAQPERKVIGRNFSNNSASTTDRHVQKINIYSLYIPKHHPG